MELIKLVEKWLDKILPIGLILACFIIILTRIPFYDEAHSFLLSSFSFGELFEISRIEGHPLFWFLLLKPLNNPDFYPYSILFLTFIISASLIIFFWKKAPFSNFIKALVLLSFPFLGCFFILARPYGINILFLFLLAFLFEKSTKKSILYSSILAICANITIMGAIGASTFFVLFIKKIIQEKVFLKKEILFSLLIVFLGVLLLFVQLNNPQIPDKITEIANEVKDNLFYYFVFPFKNYSSKTFFQNLFQISFFLFFYFSLFVFAKRSINSLIFVLVSYFVLSLLFLEIYCGAIWHYFFYFVFFVIALWIGWDKIKDLKIYKSFLIFLLFLILNPFSFLNDNQIKVLKDTKHYMPILNRILSDDEMKNSKLYCFEKNSYLAPALLPYLEKNNISLYDINGYKRGSFESYIKTFSNKNKEIKNFIESLDKTKNNYLLMNNLSNMEILNNVVVRQNGYIINLELVDVIKESIFAIYKIEVVQENEF
ncbi:MAG: hypothetical protein IJB79_07890 [Candidatus Gastranaerophilales bacterium]|nr:hypothetical protein [Candidatus Gastranaerophilales bacterium]